MISISAKVSHDSQAPNGGCGDGSHELRAIDAAETVKRQYLEATMLCIASDRLEDLEFSLRLDETGGQLNIREGGITKTVHVHSLRLVPKSRDLLEEAHVESWGSFIVQNLVIRPECLLAMFECHRTCAVIFMKRIDGPALLYQSL